MMSAKPFVEELEKRELLSAYYVSPLGSDFNSGLDPKQAWQTVARANQAVLNPGDKLLFKGSCAFVGNLVLDPADGGDPSNPAVVGSYGDGKAEIDVIQGDGIYLTSGGITISDLILRGEPGDVGNGINAPAWGQDVTGLHILNCDISGFGWHTGAPQDPLWNGGGIQISNSGYAPYGEWRDVQIVGCNIHDNILVGIQVWGTEGFAIDGNTVSNIPGIATEDSAVDSGSGLVVGSSRNGEVARNDVFGCGHVAASAGSGIGAIFGTGIVVDHNVVHDNHSWDGGQICFDDVGYSQIISNYVYDCTGSGAFVMGPFDSNDTAFGDVLAYNVSVDNPTGINLEITADTGTLAHNNTVIVGTGEVGAQLYLHGLGGKDVIFDNLFVANQVDYYFVNLQDGDPVAYAGLLQNNVYWSYVPNQISTAPPDDQTFRVLMNGTVYHSLDDMRVFKQEQDSAGNPLGEMVDPGINAASAIHVEDLQNPDALDAYAPTNAAMYTDGTNQDTYYAALGQAVAALEPALEFWGNQYSWTSIGA